MLEQSSVTVDNHKIITHISHVTFERCVILVHGFTWDMHGPANLYDKLTESLINTWYSVIQFNSRWTFPSEMDFSDMTLETERQDLEAIIHFVKERGYKELSLVWESMGGIRYISIWKVFSDTFTCFLVWCL